MKKFFLFYCFIILIITNKSLAEDFFFEGEEIQVINNGEILKSNNGIKITSTNDIIITAQEFEFNKKRSELLVKDNVIVNDKKSDIIIKSDKIRYLKNIEQIQTFEDTLIEI